MSGGGGGEASTQIQPATRQSRTSMNRVQMFDVGFFFFPWTESSFSLLTQAPPQPVAKTSRQAGTQEDSVAHQSGLDHAGQGGKK